MSYQETWSTWIECVCDGLGHLRQKNEKKGGSAHHLLHPFYTEILEEPAGGWSGRVRPVLIDFLGDHPYIVVKSKTPIFHEVIRAKTYVETPEAMEMLGIDEAEFERLQQTDLWGMIQYGDVLGSMRYRVGTLVKLKRVIDESR